MANKHPLESVVDDLVMTSNAGSRNGYNYTVKLAQEVGSYSARVVAESGASALRQWAAKIALMEDIVPYAWRR